MTSLKVEKTNVDQDLSKILTPKVRKEIDHWVKKYPKDQKQSAVMQALTIVQDHSVTHSLDNQAILAVANYLEMDPIAVEEVATFYSMYSFEPQGKYRFCVCDNLSCKMRGSDDIISYLSKKLGIKKGQTTADGRYSLKTVECLGACVDAPMMQLNKDYVADLNEEKVDQILEKIQEDESWN